MARPPVDLFDDFVCAKLLERRPRRATVTGDTGHNTGPDNWTAPSGDRPETSKRRTDMPDAPGRQTEDFSALLAQSLLDFSSLKGPDMRATVACLEPGRYRLTLGNARVAFNPNSLRDLLQHDNPDHDLTFSDDLISFEPPEELIKKSKLPLWVIKPVGSKTVYIERVWK